MNWQIPEKDSLEPTPETKLRKFLYSDKIYTYTQKFTFLKWNIAFSVFIIFSSIVQIAMLYSGSWNLNFGKTYLLVLISLSLIYGFLSFLANICIIRHEFHEIKDFYLSMNLKFLGFLFIFSTLFMVAKLLMIFVLLLALRYIPNPSTGQIISLVLISIDVIALTFSIFTYFTIEGSKTTVRILLYLAGLILIIMSFLLIFSSQKVSELFSSENELNPVIINYAFRSLKGISIVSIIIIETVFLFSLRKFNFWFFMGANWTLVIAILFALLNGFLIKNLHQINGFFKQTENCVTALKYLNEEYLASMECANKYVEMDMAPYLDCPLEEQAFIWESTTNWSKNACINMDCCEEPLSLIYFSDIMAIYLLSLGIIALGFIIIACIYYITTMYRNKQIEYPISTSFNKLMAFLYILIPLLGILYLSYMPMVLPTKQEFFPANYQSNSSNLIQYPANTTDYTSSCFLLSDYLTDFNPKLSLSKCVHIIQINESDVCNDEMRVILLIENGQIYIPQDFNSQELRIFDQRSKNFAISQKAQNYDDVDYLAFEGAIDYLKVFMQQTVQVCANSLFETISYTYSVYQIGVSSYSFFNSSDDINLTSHKNQKHRSIANSYINSSIINFNLTDNKTFAVVGQLMGNSNESMDGSHICFTEDNPETGVNYQCLQETSSENDGSFSLQINQLINNVAFQGYLQFLKSGYYPLQIELLLLNNQDNIINIGYLQMNAMNNSINETNSTSKDKNTSTSNTASSSDSLANVQLELNNVNFGNLTLNITDMLTLESLNQVYIILYGSAVDCKANLEVQSLGSFYTQIDQNLTFYNLEYNTYTFFLSKKSYKTNCLQITINSDSKYQTVLLSPLLQNNQVRILLQWENSDLDLGLFLMYKTPDNTSKCVVSYQNKECLGAEMIIHNDLNGTNAHIITIDSWVNLTYLTYVKEIIGRETYTRRQENNETLNMNFLYYSKLILRYYVPELELPVLISNGISVDQSYNMTEVLTEENLAYFFICIEGGVGDIGKTPSKVLWTKSYYNKTEESEYPENEVCGT